MGGLRKRRAACPSICPGGSSIPYVLDMVVAIRRDVLVDTTHPQAVFVNTNGEVPAPSPRCD